MKYILTALLYFIISASAHAQKPDLIIGRWLAYPLKNLIIDVYKTGNEYKGKIVWFNDSDDKTKPMNTRKDEKNPDPELRNRKVLGLEVLEKLVYNPKSKMWEDGKIYDAKTGKTFNASAALTADSTLAVRGFWHFEFIGQNMNFKRM